MAAPPPATTKAWSYTKGGFPRQALKLTTTHPLPVFPPNDTAAANEEWLLVRVSYAALNPGDILVMNVLPAALRKTKTMVPGYDIVGTVLDVWTPPSSTQAATTTTSSTANPPPRFSVGDSIIAFIVLSHMLRTGAGGLQGVVAFPARFAVPLPRGKSPREAAGLFLAACTAAQQVVEAGVGTGDRVLVFGASGGVGSMAVQIARETVGAGGTVLAVCSGRNVEMVKGLGADEVIDYTQFAKVEDELARRFGDQPFDAIVDGFGSQAVYKSCARYLKPGGIYSAAGVHASSMSVGPVLKSGLVMFANAIWPRSVWLGGTGRTWKAVSMMDPGRELMERLVGMFGEGKLRVAVDSEWPFEQVLEAYDVLVSGRARGKVIIKVNGEGGGDGE
ncbi:hypothetical protein B0T19DRAFT_186331 [Cercophora scortea]|uniref:Enoyl reductase (ER) domain-containing protein n=1 Tax=Cercophora scortea TaxID=314031 RepID=A0AAE0INS8_9PEZI|nr:hypothetical protein B0T19DRAFT_186331 [Cercophora scortea]